jgi:hypothetical protein
VTVESATPDIGRASAIGGNVLAMLCMEAVARQSRNVHAGARLASDSGHISSLRRRRRDKYVIASPFAQEVIAARSDARAPRKVKPIAR